MDDSSAKVPMTMLVGPTGVGNSNAGYPYPVYMGGNAGGNSGGIGSFGNDGWGIIVIILILAALGGWGNNGGNNGGGFGTGAPIIVNDGGSNGGAVQRGFDQAATMAGLSGIQSGISGLSTQICGCCGDISTQLCNGFNGVTSTITGGVNTLAQQMYTNQIADMERSFAAQTASTQGMTAIQSQLAQCCCDNRLATESLRATVLQENCQDRYEAQNNTRDIIDSQTRSTQAILDKLCALELDNYKRENDQLRTQLNMANLAASQTAQTALIRDGQNAAVNALVTELRSCPIPSQPVYGNTPIFTCAQAINPANSGCGCGCNGNF